MLCPKCGAKNEDTAKFCIKCGQPLSEKVRPARASKKLLWLMGMLMLAAVCVVCVIAGVLVYPHFREKAGIGVYGTYINRDNPDEYLELKRDGTFYLKEAGIGFTGKWEIVGDVLRLYLSGLGLAVEGRLEGNRIIDDDGKVWVKQSAQVPPGARTDIAGTFVREDDPDEYLELKEDGTFYAGAPTGEIYSGRWTVSGDTITVRFTTGEVVRFRIEGNTLVAENGVVYVRK